MYYLQTFSRKIWEKEHRFLEHHLILIEHHPNNSGAREFRHFICKGFTSGSIRCPSYLVAMRFQRLHGTRWSCKNNTLSWLHHFIQIKIRKMSLTRYSLVLSTLEREAFFKTLQGWKAALPRQHCRLPLWLSLNNFHIKHVEFTRKEPKQPVFFLSASLAKVTLTFSFSGTVTSNKGSAGHMATWY